LKPVDVKEIARAVLPGKDGECFRTNALRPWKLEAVEPPRRAVSAKPRDILRKALQFRQRQWMSIEEEVWRGGVLRQSGWFVCEYGKRVSEAVNMYPWSKDYRLRILPGHNPQ
jgi:hypothetical protein